MSLSQGQAGRASVSNMSGGRGSSRGAGGGGGGRSAGTNHSPGKHYAVNQPITIQENIRSPENAQAMIINNISAAKTCDPRYGSNNLF